MLYSLYDIIYYRDTEYKRHSTPSSLPRREFGGDIKASISSEMGAFSILQGGETSVV